MLLENKGQKIEFLAGCYVCALGVFVVSRGAAYSSGQPGHHEPGLHPPFLH